MAEWNILDFGAKRDGQNADSDANDAAFAKALSALGSTGGRLLVPHGSYVIGQPLVFRKLRNVVVVGDGGNYAHPGTRVIYARQNPVGCLHLNTCIHTRFEDICFVVDEAGPEAVVRIDAVEDGANAVSSLNNAFNACTFRAGLRAGQGIRGVSLKDAAHTEFRHCWFQVPTVAACIGAPMRTPRPTISNGQCSNTVFDNCILFGDVIGERGTNVTFQNCEFATLANGDGAKIDFGTGDNPHVCNVTIRDCFAINGKTHRGAFFSQGRDGAGFAMTNSRIRGYEVGVDLNGAGAAMLAANVFEQTAPGAVDIKIRCSPDSVSMLANSHQKTLDAGNRPVVQVKRKP